MHVKNVHEDETTSIKPKETVNKLSGGTGARQKVVLASYCWQTSGLASASEWRAPVPQGRLCTFCSLLPDGEIQTFF